MPDNYSVKWMEMLYISSAATKKKLFSSAAIFSCGFTVLRYLRVDVD